jgi:lactate permease
MTGRQLPLLSLFVPFWLVFMMDGLRGATGRPALVAGLSFAVTQYFTSNFIGPELPDITSALASLISLTLFLKVWQPNAPPARTSPAPLGVGAASAGGFGLTQHRRLALQPGADFSGLVAVPDPHRAGDHLDLKPFKAMFAAGGSMWLGVQLRHPIWINW